MVISGNESGLYVLILVFKVLKFYRHSTTPMMSQQKLEKTLPLIENAAKILVKDLIKPGKEYDTKVISSAYTIKAIMSSGFSIGNDTKITFR